MFLSKTQDRIVAGIEDRIERATHLPFSHSEQLQVLKWVLQYSCMTGPERAGSSTAGRVAVWACSYTPDEWEMSFALLRVSLVWTMSSCMQCFGSTTYMY